MSIQRSDAPAGQKTYPRLMIYARDVDKPHKPVFLFIRENYGVNLMDPGSEGLIERHSEYIDFPGSISNKD